MATPETLDATLGAHSYLYAEREGVGEPERIMLLHPFMTDAAIWRSTVEQLVSDEVVQPGQAVEVFAPTYAGHHRGPRLEGNVGAASLGDSVERAMDAIGWESAHVVGNSLGGALALETGKRGRAQTITAIAPAGGWEPGSKAEHDLIAKFDAARPLMSILRMLPPQVSEFIAYEPHVRELVMKIVTEHGRNMSREDAAHLIRAAGRCTLLSHINDPSIQDEGMAVADMETITNPVLLLVAEKDKVVPYNPYMHGFAKLPNVTEVVLEGLGHCPQLEQPKRIASEVLGHIAGQSVLAA